MSNVMPDPIIFFFGVTLFVSEKVMRWVRRYEKS